MGTRQRQAAEGKGGSCVGHGCFVHKLLLACPSLVRRTSLLLMDKPTNKTSKSIYVSPSIEYAAFLCYAQFCLIASSHWAQIFLQCRVRPGSFSIHLGTLGHNKHWSQDVPINVNYPSLDGLERFLEDPQNIIVYGLMVHEFGLAACCFLGCMANNDNKSVF